MRWAGALVPPAPEQFCGMIHFMRLQGLHGLSPDGVRAQGPRSLAAIAFAGIWALCPALAQDQSPPASALQRGVVFAEYPPFSRSIEVARRTLSPLVNVAIRRASAGSGLLSQAIDLKNERFAVYVSRTSLDRDKPHEVWRLLGKTDARYGGWHCPRSSSSNSGSAHDASASVSSRCAFL